MLIAGDEMGPLGDLSGSDANLLVHEAVRSTAVSVGVEPGGVPPGVIWLGGGPEAFRALLADQLARRHAHHVPTIDGAPGWSLVIDGIDPQLERAHESLLTLADGRIGTRGTPLGDHPATMPLLVAAGVYRGSGAETELRPGPRWNRLAAGIDPERPARRTLDLRVGLMRQELSLQTGRLEAILFSSMARPGTAVLRAAGPLDAQAGSEPLLAPDATGAAPVESGIEADCHWAWAGAEAGGLAAAAAEVRTGERVGEAGPDRGAIVASDRRLDRTGGGTARRWGRRGGRDSSASSSSIAPPGPAAGRTRTSRSTASRSCSSRCASPSST